MKNTVYLLLLLTFPLNASVKLSVSSPEVPANQPFSITLSVQSQEQLGRPAIDGLSQFIQQGTSSTSKFVVRNGAMSAERSFVYSLRAEKPGTYMVGPARIMVGNQEQVSDIIKITVVAAAKTDERGPGFIELTSDKKTVMVGQPVTVTLSLYVRDGVQLAQPLALDFARSGWAIAETGQVQSTQKTIKGQIYHVHSQQFVLKSNSPGTKTIPALTAEIAAPARQNQNIFDMFGFGRHEFTQVRSEPLTITVTDLPPFKGTVHGVGNFTSFEAELVRTTARVGEGVVFKLKAIGTGATEHVPELVLPDGVTAYESRHQNNTFEYIVQGVQPGNYKIPAQEFTFFDQEKNKYRTLKSKPITLVATGVATEPTKTTPQTNESVAPTQVTTPSAVPSAPVNYKRILLLLALGLTGLLLLWLLFKKLRAWYQSRQTVQATAFKRAYKNLAYLQKTQNAAGLYQLFITLFTERTAVPVGDVTEFTIRAKLFELGVAQQQIDEFLNFMSEITEIAFAKRSPRAGLFAQAEQWLGQLRRWL